MVANVAASHPVNALRMAGVNDGPVPDAVTNLLVKVLAVALKSDSAASYHNQEIEVKSAAVCRALELTGNLRIGNDALLDVRVENVLNRAVAGCDVRHRPDGRLKIECRNVHTRRAA